MIKEQLWVITYLMSKMGHFTGKKKKRLIGKYKSNTCRHQLRNPRQQQYKAVISIIFRAQKSDSRVIHLSSFLTPIFHVSLLLLFTSKCSLINGNPHCCKAFMRPFSSCSPSMCGLVFKRPPDHCSHYTCAQVTGK